MEYLFENGNVIIKNAVNFDLAQTLDCGQAFRFRENEDGSWTGIAYKKEITLKKDNEDIILIGTTKEDFLNIWQSYFDLERNYAEIIATVSQNEIIKTAAEYGNGIRILRQEPWEALCSFIISQNNNIPRIKGIIERLCEGFGEKVGNGYSFPDAKTVSKLSLEDLAPLRSGFRAKYILDAAKKVASGEINLIEIANDDYITAGEKLMKISGVGPKVSDCALLFGFGKIEAFPRDVWIKRAMDKLFGGELPECALSYAGIVQQYIFYYARENDI